MRSEPFTEVGLKVVTDLQARWAKLLGVPIELNAQCGWRTLIIGREERHLIYVHFSPTGAVEAVQTTQCQHDPRGNPEQRKLLKRVKKLAEEVPS